MADDQEQDVIRRIARFLRLVPPDDKRRHAESRSVLAEAHKEIAESRAARLHEMSLRLDVRARR